MIEKKRPAFSFSFETFLTSIWLPISVFLILATVLSSLAWHVNSVKQEHLRDKFTLFTNNIENHIYMHLDMRTNALKRNVQRWNHSLQKDVQNWQQDATNLIDDFNDIEAIEFIDSNLQSRWVVPPQKSQVFDETGDDFLVAAKMADENGKSKFSPTSSKSLKMANGEKGVAFFEKVSTRDDVDGYIVWVLNFNRLFQDALRDEDGNAFGVSMFHDNEVVFASQGYQRDVSPWERTYHFNLANANWRITLWPTNYWLDEYESNLPYLLFAGGLIISFLLAFAIRSAQLYKSRGLEIESTNESLEIRVAERTSDLQIVNEKLKLAKESAESSNKAKSQFLANMSHELRTPLTAILGFAEIIIDDSCNDQNRAKECASVIKRNGKHLLDLLNDILDLAKVESRKTSVEISEFSFAKEVESIVDLLRVHAETKQVSLVMSFGPGIPSSIYSDQKKIRQVLFNIIGNAVKFTKSGKISVRTDFQKSFDCDDGSKSLVKVYVKDTGCGIPEDKQNELFAPFSQADSSMVRKHGGTGLGLYLSRSLANMLGGDINLLSSSEDVGSEFLITFSVSLTDPATQTIRISPALLPEAKENNNHENLKGMRILLAEDGIDNQRLYQYILSSYGASVDVADDGEKAITAATALNYDIILMDIQMPNLDGYQATKKLRALGCEIPILALSAHAMKEEKQKCFQAGCNDYISKPVETDLLVQKISQWG